VKMKLGKSGAIGVLSILSLSPLMLACAAKRVVLVPAPSTTVTSTRRFKGALGHDAGVRIIAATNDWNGTPANLYKFVTPVRVRIDNNSGHPLQISYDNFRLASPSGRVFIDLPPADIKGRAYVGQNLAPGVGSMPVPVYDAYRAPSGGARIVRIDDEGDDEGEVIAPDFDFDGFYAAPYWAYGYSGMTPWPYSWSPDWGYYNMYYPYMRRIHLPTRSMLRRGIPEGVIANGGHIDGFLYFAEVSDNVPRVNLIARLVDARTHREFGQIEIPFVVRK